MDNKVRFILGVVKGDIIVNNRKRADLLSDLKNKGFTPFPKKAKSSDPPVVGADPIGEDGEEVGSLAFEAEFTSYLSLSDREI